MKERFVPLRGMTVVGPAVPTDPECLAAARFVREIRRTSGLTLPVVWDDAMPTGPAILVGNRATLGRLLAAHAYPSPKERDGEDVGRQSYVLDVLSGRGSRRPIVLALGQGLERTARGHLGTSYALGELLRRLDVRKGVWGFALPAGPLVASPHVPNRTLYIMNSSLKNPGLSLEYFSDEQLEEYVDRLVEARYSRVCFWQWSEYYLYPGNVPTVRAESERTHQVMRKFFAYARRRGLETYHMLTPSHVKAELLPNETRFRATGYYGPFSICWSQPEARALAREVARTEMEYFGPMDGYMVWFYDPGGCFCSECAAHQSERIFDQFTTVVDLARTISPNARFQAALWPTWAFARQTEGIGHPGRGYTETEVRDMVRDFLRRCLERFGRRNLTIIDSCEGDETNIYNGNVDPAQFRRCAFMYSVLGMTSEQAYPFPHFRLKYLADQMSKARDRGLEEAMLFLQYSATNFPLVYTFADTLYEGGPDWTTTADRLAATYSKGDARSTFRQFLQAEEDLSTAQSTQSMVSAVERLERSATKLVTSDGFVGDREWLRGYVLAQRYYLQMAMATSDADLADTLARFKHALSSIPMYRDYAQRTLDASLVRTHLKALWNTALAHGKP